jgi:hypothetical protein
MYVDMAPCNPDTGSCPLSNIGNPDTLGGEFSPLSNFLTRLNENVLPISDAHASKDLVADGNSWSRFATKSLLIWDP